VRFLYATEHCAVGLEATDQGGSALYGNKETIGFLFSRVGSINSIQTYCALSWEARPAAPGSIGIAKARINEILN
jgi:hypothetical protein